MRRKTHVLICLMGLALASCGGKIGVALPSTDGSSAGKPNEGREAIQQASEKHVVPESGGIRFSGVMFPTCTVYFSGSSNYVSLSYSGCAAEALPLTRTSGGFEFRLENQVAEIQIPSSRTSATLTFGSTGIAVDGTQIPLPDRIRRIDLPAETMYSPTIHFNGKTAAFRAAISIAGTQYSVRRGIWQKVSEPSGSLDAIAQNWPPPAGGGSSAALVLAVPFAASATLDSIVYESAQTPEGSL